jgi:hypothetical protein
VAPIGWDEAFILKKNLQDQEIINLLTFLVAMTMVGKDGRG